MHSYYFFRFRLTLVAEQRGVKLPRIQARKGTREGSPFFVFRLPHDPLRQSSKEAPGYKTGRKMRPLLRTPSYFERIFWFKGCPVILGLTRLFWKTHKILIALFHYPPLLRSQFYPPLSSLYTARSLAVFAATYVSRSKIAFFL